jgi:2-polyprenyl-3-methyl-5-hydroxy-6-metoxy-1,4-benzoquinol methylase
MENTNPYIDKISYLSSHSQIACMLATLPSGSRILDVGSATGTLARTCAGRGYIIRGIEPNADSIGKSRDLYTDLFAGSLEQAP